MNLISMLKETAKYALDNLPTTYLNPNDGITYHFMHPKIRNKAIDCALMNDI